MQNTLDKDELITGGYVGIFHQDRDRVQGQDEDPDHRHRRVSFHFQLLDLCIYFPSPASVPIMKIIMIICGVQNQPRPRSGHWSPLHIILWKLTIAPFMSAHSFGSRLDMLDIEIGLAKGW